MTRFVPAALVLAAILAAPVSMSSAPPTKSAVAMADATYLPVAEAATVQVAASVIVTAILTPLLTSWQYRRVIREEARKAALGAPHVPVVEPDPTASRKREADLA